MTAPGDERLVRELHNKYCGCHALPMECDSGIAKSFDAGRRAGLEEAARVAEDLSDDDCSAGYAATRIRALLNGGDSGRDT